MGISKKRTIVLGLVIIVVTVTYFFINSLNDFQSTGELQLAGLSAPVKVIRDEKGMAYLYGETMEDVVFAQGFITAQDRLFSMELMRLLATGRLSEIFGDATKHVDIRMRTIGFYREALKHEKMLGERDRRRYQRYIDGLNAFLENHFDERPLKLKLVGVKQEKWTIAHSLAMLYYLGWNSAANVRDEIVTQMLIEKLGAETVKSLLPLNFNPDDPSNKPIEYRFTSINKLGVNIDQLALLDNSMADKTYQVGSNNWVANKRISEGELPILANDPHLNANNLPGPWYPIGLITPDLRLVGVTIPGFPGMTLGRTSNIAMGVTNGYGDAQDLYIEITDPQNSNNYLEGTTSVPFKTINEVVKIKDKESNSGFREEKLVIRLTKRGPVISDAFQELKSNKIITLRWAAFETMGADLGLIQLVDAKNVEEARDALSHVNAIMLNYVLADTQGNIAWQPAGKLPIRSQTDGSIPYAVHSEKDNWLGYIPWEDMPRSVNPDDGWVGTCNHTVVDNSYPYYYSSHFATSWRQRRIKQLFATPGKKTADDFWNFQHDTKNLMAEKIVPTIVGFLKEAENFKDISTALESWDYHDNPEQVAPMIFHALFRHMALLTFQDELGEELSMSMLKKWYYWEERFVKMIENGSSQWFDKINTNSSVEELRDIVIEAAHETRKELTEKIGPDIENWKWGELHKLEFVSYIRRSGFGKELLGGGSYAYPGSLNTLSRGIYNFDEPFMANTIASLKMVVDLNDPDKILAVLPGGTSGRLLNPHRTDQIEPFVKGEKLYWWFSDKAIEENAQSELTLMP